MEGSAPDDPRKLAIAYLRQLAAESDEGSRAYDEVHRRVGRRGGANDGFRVVLALLEAAATDQELNYVAAGPLEDLVIHWGVLLVGQLEEEAKRNPKFQFALQGIWLREDDLPEPVMKRVIAASGDMIKPLPADNEGPQAGRKRAKR